MRPEKLLTSPTILLPFLAEVFKPVKREKEMRISPFEDYWLLLISWNLMRLKSGFIDKRGREVIPLKYDDVRCVAFRKEGFIGVKLNGKKGFVDIYGTEYFDLVR
jgi:hypothetical protein